MKRRQLLKTVAAGSVLAWATKPGISIERKTQKNPFKYCLNTSTISGQNPGLLGYIKIASKAGYSGVELWVKDVKEYLNKGNTAASLNTILNDANITVENAIGFAPWLKNNEGMKQMKVEMEMMKSIGCKRIAAPASGLGKDNKLDFAEAAQKFHKLLEIGKKTGVQPCLEFWGTSPVLSNMGQALHIAAQSRHPDAKILADVYHMFRGGSGFESLKLISGNALEIFHMNDYPGNIPRLKQTDANRVYPGDGVAPLKQILTDLKNMGGEKVLSLELFNRKYWNQDAETVAKTGIEKMKNLVTQII